MSSVLNHVAILVPSVQNAADYLKRFDFEIGPAQRWENEGTLEIYVGNRKLQHATLLLIEPFKEGAYTRAMSKRGAGLHHLAIDVIHLESFLDTLSGSGWLLHPKSIKTMKERKTVWLARPGIPTLIEVQEKEYINKEKFFIEAIKIPSLSTEHLKMFSILGLDTVHTGDLFTLNIQGNKIELSVLI